MRIIKISWRKMEWYSFFRGFGVGMIVIGIYEYFYLKFN